MELKNKSVLVVGAGKSGISAARFLRERGAKVTISDSRSAAALAGELPGLMDAGIMVEAGGHGLLTFRRQDLIVVSPGVPMDTPEVKQVVALGMPVIGELELASRFLQGQVIAITGSNGKTTTTTLVGEILKRAGLATLVGGNIGLPVIELVAESRPETWSVLEVSSFQLETVEEFRPRIAAVLNITPDHLDRHKSLQNYAAAKARITERQEAEEFLVLNAENKDAQMVGREDSGAGVLVLGAAGDQAGGVCAWGEHRLRPAGGCEGRAGDAGGGDHAEGRAQRGECAGGGDDCAAGGCSGRGDSRGGRVRSRRWSTGWSW